ncbi:unnamed protein product, partial [marine sediment metagenome]
LREMVVSLSKMQKIVPALGYADFSGVEHAVAFNLTGLPPAKVVYCVEQG